MSSSTGNEKKLEDWMAPPSEPEHAILPPSYEEATGQEIAQLPDTEDIIQIRENEAGLISRPGATGKFYCCGDLGEDPCSCPCSGCGPTNGCNCAPCQKLDIATRKLPKNFYVNREGAACRRSRVSGLFHCGRKLYMGSEVRCGPDGGEQCQYCQLMGIQVDTKYKGVWRQDAEESTAQRGITNAAPVFEQISVVEDVTTTKTNEAGQTSQLGESGKFYCGGDLGEDLCSCCSGCGPTSGCNCAPCQKLDIATRKLPKNYYVNREGAACRRSNVSGMFHCGRKLYIGSTVRCGPDGGRQCQWCKLIEAQVENAYRGIWSHQRGMTNAAPVEDVIATKTNEAGQSSLLGESGKFYCGRDLGEDLCSCCSGCGPTSGCNCAPCQKLDIASRKLPKNFYVNRVGAPCRKSHVSGLFHCGRKLYMGSTVRCGPDDGEQCQWCQLIDAQVENAYRAVWSQDPEESTAQRGITNAAPAEDVIATQTNEAGRTSRPGESGKFYCGGDLGEDHTCCSGCGPTNGCNCAPCQKLDIASRKLPKNFYVNREGASCRRSRETGLIYCGRKVAHSGDGHCGPNDGPQCQMCSTIQTQVEVGGYRAVW